MLRKFRCVQSKTDVFHDRIVLGNVEPSVRGLPKKGTPTIENFLDNIFGRRLLCGHLFGFPDIIKPLRVWFFPPNVSSGAH